MLDCPEGRCESCGTPLTGRQKKCCSARCRAALSRRMRAEAQEDRERRIQGLLKETLRLLKHEGEDSA